MEFRPWLRHACAPEIRDDDDAAWRAFDAYLLQPNRNLGRLALERKLSPTAVHRWAHEGFWRQRAEAFDRHLNNIRDQVVEASVTEQTRALATMLRLGTRELSLLAQAQHAVDRPGVIAPGAAMRMVDRAVTLLQLLAGKPTERVAAVEQDLSKLTPEQLERLAEIRAALDS